VSSDLRETWSIIVGYARGAESSLDSSFIQVIEGASARTWWFEFPAGALRASRRRLEVEIGGSRFGEEGISLDLEGPEGRFRGELRFGPLTRLPFSLLRPGVMGPYSFIPFMECNHGLVSLDHELSGWLEVEGRRIDFAGGRGYAEKDWGSSMPSAWIWTQSNNFASRGDSLMFSLATIPWLGSSFNGFLCAGSLGGRRLLEASWTGAGARLLSLADDRVELEIRRGAFLLELLVRRARGGLLRAPVAGILSRRIAESVDALLELRVSEGGETWFEGSAAKAGLEVVGEASSFLEPDSRQARAKRRRA
jgi:hypothetical protein